MRAEGQGTGVRGKRRIRQAGGRVFEFTAANNATFDDDGSGGLDISVTADVGAAVVAERGLVGVDEGVLVGEDSSGVGDHGVSARETGDGRDGAGEFER